MSPLKAAITSWQKANQGIWPLVWPIMLSNLSVPLLGAVDTAILGHLPTATYLAAVAVGSSVITLIFWSLGFLRMGTTSLVARAFGAGDHERNLAHWLRSALVAVVLALLIWLISGPLTYLALGWIQPAAEAQALASRYCEIRFWSTPATLLNYTLVGWFIGNQNTRKPLYMLLLTNAINIVLDLVLIVGMGLGSDGAAMASVIAEYSGLALGLWMLRASLRQFKLQNTWAKRLKSLTLWHDYSPLLHVNRHLFVRTLCLLGVFTFFTAQGARAGSDILAANAILLQLLLFTSNALDGFAHAAEALCGKAAGGNSLEELQRVTYATGTMALLLACAISVFFWATQDLLLPLFSDLPEVLQEARRQYGWIIAMPILAVLAYQLDGVFIGLGLTRAMQYAMVGCTCLGFFPLWWLSSPLGNSGLWLAFSTFNLARGVVMAWVYHRHLQTSLYRFMQSKPHLRS